MSKILFAAVLLAAFLPLRATTYYVSNAGNDTSAGKSPAEAWATAARVTSAKLIPGDVVRFEAGGIWREQLVPQGGDAFAKIVYGAYGPGNKPLFLGSLNFNSPAQWTDLGANRWATANGSFPFDVGSINFNNPSYIDNPSFTTDLAGWFVEANAAAGAAATLVRDSATYDSAPASGAITVTGRGRAAGDVRFSRDHLSLSKGKTYQLRFRAKGSTDFTLARPRLVPRANPVASYDAVTFPWSGRVTTEWTTLTVDVIANADANDARLEFGLGGTTEGTLWLDDITLSEITEHPSIVANPSFAQDLEGWTLHATNRAAAICRRETATYDTAPACAGITVTAQGGAAADVQLSAKNLPVTEGRLYRLSFRTRATAEFALPPPRLFDPAGPQRVVGDIVREPDARITDRWSTWIAEYRAVATCENAVLAIDLGNSVPRGASVYFDDVSFKEVYPHPSVDTTLQNANIAVRRRNEAQLSAQDNFWYDADNRRVIVWSKTNPATLHDTIECALSRYMCNIVRQSNILIDGLAFWNGAKDCVQLDRADDIVVTHCDLRFIGGGYTASPGSTIRYGNAFQLWNTVSHVTITENYVLNIYDAGIANQGLSVNQEHHFYYRYNTLLACHYSFELWDRPVGSTMHDIYFEHNLCRDAGTGFSYAQRPDPQRASHLLLALTTATSSHIVIRNNLFDSSVRSLIWRTPDLLDNFEDWDIDHNTYQGGANGIALWAGKRFGPGDWEQYREASGKDAHSVLEPRSP